VLPYLAGEGGYRHRKRVGVESTHDDECFARPDRAEQVFRQEIHDEALCIFQCFDEFVILSELVVFHFVPIYFVLVLQLVGIQAHDDGLLLQLELLQHHFNHILVELL